MKKPILFLAPLFVPILLAGGAYAFMGANNVPVTHAGTGQGEISGYNVTGVTYSIDGKNDQATGIDFDVDGPATDVSVVKLAACTCAFALIVAIEIAKTCIRRSLSFMTCFAPVWISFVSAFDAVPSTIFLWSCWTRWVNESLSWKKSSFTAFPSASVTGSRRSLNLAALSDFNTVLADSPGGPPGIVASFPSATRSALSESFSSPSSV